MVHFYLLLIPQSIIHPLGDENIILPYSRRKKCHSLKMKGFSPVIFQ
jgi:hypothetical protein